MPMHDWTRVEAGIFHAFHHEWISEISRTLNRGLLPGELYALPEQVAAGFGPDVLTLQNTSTDSDETGSTTAIVVRHISGDRIVAMIEIVSPGNKGNKNAFKSFVDKSAELLGQGIHLLILDPFPPGPRDPNGVHSAIWSMIDGVEFQLPEREPLTFVAYDAGPLHEAFIETLAVGDILPEMPLFLEPGGHVLIPLEATYQAAWETVPRRWQKVIAPPPTS